ncbi:MAG: hypothetical protein ACSHX8_01375 [Opitutaceae bacterium]
MSIHILTTDENIVEQLTQLLAGGQEAFHFYTDLEVLISVVQKLKKKDMVFYDLQLESTMWAYDALRFGTKKTNLIAFEPAPEGDSESVIGCPEKAPHYLLLSSDIRKSKVRLQKVMLEVNQKHVKKTAKRRAAKKSAAKAKLSRDAALNTQYRNDAASPVTITRYLVARSPSMQELVARICETANKASMVLIEAEDGAEFELAARELNFRANGDGTQLMVLDPMHLCAAQMKILAKGKDAPYYCYIGLSYELTAESVEQLADTLKLITEKGDGSPIRLILGHVADSESYVGGTAMALVKSFREDGARLELPSMSERKEDVHAIAQTVFTTLRVAHPFLCTRILSTGALQFLEDSHESFDYSKLVRVIRNAMALTERDTLTERELKNFSDDSPTSQHMIESFADEKFFKDQSGVA